MKACLNCKTKEFLLKLITLF